MPELISNFERLLGRRATEEEIESLRRVKKTLGLADNDALWMVLIALEYYDVLYRQYPAQIASQMEKTLQRQQATLAAAADAECRRAVAALLGREHVPADMGVYANVNAARSALYAAWTIFAMMLFGAFCASVGYLLASGYPPVWARAIDSPGLPTLLSMLARTPAGWIAPVLAGFLGLGIWTGRRQQDAIPLARNERMWLFLGWLALSALMLLVALPLA